MLSLIKLLAYKIIPSWFYYQITFYVNKKKLQNENYISLKKNKPKLIFDVLKNKLNFNKVFVLGSGSSINELSSKNFDEINNNCSVGINKWIFHDFIPNIYMIELNNDYDLNEKIRLQILFILKKKSKDPIFLIYNLANSNVDIQKWTKNMDPEKVFFYKFLRPNIFKKEVKKEILSLLKFLPKINKISNVITLGAGSTAERVIVLSLLFGSSKIILLGIDLNNTKYFWSQKDTNFKNIQSGQENHGYHLTALKKFGGIPAQETILILSKLAKKYFNSKIFISTKRSLLSSKLEKYVWEDK